MHRLIAFVLLASIALFGAEDPKLRQRANELAQRSIAITSPVSWPPHRYTATFQYTSADGTITEGSETVADDGGNSYRTETKFGSFYSLVVKNPRMKGDKVTEPIAPPGLREMRSVRPAYTVSFDKEDVIHDIRDSTVQGRPAFCVQFVSNFGSKSQSGEICYDKAIGALLHFQFGNEVVDSSNWVPFAGLWFPSHIEKSEEGKRVISIDQAFEPVASFPTETFEVPPDARPWIWCREYRQPIGNSMPQPDAGPGDNVDDILVQGRITSDGRVTNTGIRKSGRPDLEAEALRIAQKWTFHPAMCDETPVAATGDFLLHFKGRQ
jgi:TonB family protein